MEMKELISKVNIICHWYYSSRHLALSHFGTCMCSNVETNLSQTCLLSELLSFEHPSVLLFCSSFIISDLCMTKIQFTVFY